MSEAPTPAGAHLLGSWRVDLARWKALNASKLGWLGDLLFPMLLSKAEVRFTDSTLTMRGFGDERTTAWSYEIACAKRDVLILEGTRLGGEGRMAGEVELVDSDRVTLRFTAPKMEVIALRRNR